MTDRPIRIQLRRTKGWRMPENTVRVTRPSKWGNPFVVSEKKIIPGRHAGGSYIAVPTVEDAVACYRTRITEHRPDIAEAARRELRGKNLACFCPLPGPGAPDLCHARILLEVANEWGEGNWSHTARRGEP
jgi:hypothetical protein